MKEKQPNILVVLVIYQTELSQSTSYQSWYSLRKEWQVMHPQLLIYNNSAEVPIPCSDEYILYTAPQNDKLATAYNYALHLAVEQNISWLLLLDQDTSLSKQYIQEVEKAWMGYQNEPQVAMLLPRFMAQQNICVPYAYNPTFFHEWHRTILEPHCISSACIASYNSGIVLRVEAMQTIHGFSERYPLDYQDIDYLYRLYKAGYSGYVLDVVLQHELSVTDYKRYMSPARYQMIVDAQKQMARDCGWRCVLSLRIYMLGRMLKWLFIRDKRPYVKQTLKNLW